MRDKLAQLKVCALKDPFSEASSIVAHFVTDLQSAAVSGQIPSTDGLRQQVKKARSRAGPSLPPEPEHRKDIKMPDPLKVSFVRNYWSMLSYTIVLRG